jgi:hypothetical protein
MKEGKDGKKRGGGVGFLAGIIAGIGSVLLYSAGKNRKLGDKVADGIETFETKAKDVKDKAVHKAEELKETTVEKLKQGKEKIAGGLGHNGQKDETEA